jgi:hypothetical protein
LNQLGARATSIPWVGNALTVFLRPLFGKKNFNITYLPIHAKIEPAISIIEYASEQRPGFAQQRDEYIYLPTLAHSYLDFRSTNEFLRIKTMEGNEIESGSADQLAKNLGGRHANLISGIFQPNTEGDRGLYIAA